MVEGGWITESSHYGLPHTYIFLKFSGENRITNQSAKADVQISSINGCLVPKAAVKDSKVIGSSRPN
jgi:hypothetical protein